MATGRDMSNGPSFWKTVPGILTGMAAVLTALAGLRGAYVKSQFGNSAAPTHDTVTQIGGDGGAAAKSRFTIFRDSGPVTLPGEISIALHDVKTFKREDDPKERASGIAFDRALPGAARLLGVLLGRAKLTASPDSLLKLSQPQWEQFLGSLDKDARHTITEKPFGRLTVMVHGRNASDEYWLEGDTVSVPAKDPVVTLYVGVVINGNHQKGELEQVELSTKLHK